MIFLMNLVMAIVLRVGMILDGLGALIMLIGAFIGAPGKTLKDKGATLQADRRTPLRAFAFLRAFLPNLVLKFQLIKAYPNTGTAVVTRYVDVHDVLNRVADFEVVYEPRMEKITGGANFFLGMQDTAAYARDTAMMRLAARRDDVAQRVGPRAADLAETLVAACPGSIDVPQALTLKVPTDMVQTYLGITGASDADMAEWATLMFQYLFLDLSADPDFGERALDAAAKSRAMIDAAIADRKASALDKDDVLGRCLTMQKGGMSHLTDLDIRNNLIGLYIGAIPTLSKGSVQALDVLLDMPDALAGAQAAARVGDMGLVAAHVFEAFRFNPVNPAIYRRAARDTLVAPGTTRQRRVPEGTMVLAANLSAMFDPAVMTSPNSFRVDRPREQYMLWGYGQHACFGAQINSALMPAMLKPLLAKPNLRRAAGAAGKIDGAGTPFPMHFMVEYD